MGPVLPGGGMHQHVERPGPAHQRGEARGVREVGAHRPGGAAGVAQAGGERLGGDHRVRELLHPADPAVPEPPEGDVGVAVLLARRRHVAVRRVLGDQQVRVDTVVDGRERQREHERAQLRTHVLDDLLPAHQPLGRVAVGKLQDIIVGVEATERCVLAGADQRNRLFEDRPVRRPALDIFVTRVVRQVTHVADGSRRMV